MLGRGVQCQSAAHRGFSHSAFARDKLELCHKAILQNSPERLWRPNPLLAHGKRVKKNASGDIQPLAEYIHSLIVPKAVRRSLGAINLRGYTQPVHFLDSFRAQSR